MWQHDYKKTSNMLPHFYILIKEFDNFVNYNMTKWIF